MNNRKGIKAAGPQEVRNAGAELSDATDEHAPRKMTFTQNAILTIKVLVGFGLLGAALWGINIWTAPK
jgi:hypothetical protein